MIYLPLWEVLIEIVEVVEGLLVEAEVVDSPEVALVVEEALIGVTTVQVEIVRCLQQPVATVGKKLKYLSDQQMASQFTVATVLKNLDHRDQKVDDQKDQILDPPDQVSIRKSQELMA